ncbi:MAG: hypothetical protein AAFW73_10210 [Bacteroidota bacterium]
MPPDPPFILPLYQLFEQLCTYERRQLKHHTLSPQNYLELVEVLVRGYALVSPEDLYRLCKLLWFKPHFSESKFRALFDAHLAPYQIAEWRTPPAPPRATTATGPNIDQSTKSLDADMLPPRALEQNAEEEKELPIGEEAPVEEPTPPPGTSEEQRGFNLVAMRFEASQPETVAGAAEDWSALERHIFAKNYQLTGQYFPVGKRKIQQTIRSLRMPSFLNNRWVVDWPATIERIAKRGYFDAVQYRRQARYTNELCVLVDRGLSMVAFHQLAEEVARAVRPPGAARGNRSEPSRVYYFNNIPINYLYHDRAQTEALPVAEFIRQLHRPLLIISDAGAARGRYNRKRIEQTQRFLERLGSLPVAWLNPLPRQRWRDTSAAFIAQLVPMYAINPRELSNAIKSFKQKR